MEIAATYTVKQPARPQMDRAAAAQDDPYKDDFEAELSNAVDGPREDQGKPDKPKTCSECDTEAKPATGSETPQNIAVDPTAAFLTIPQTIDIPQKQIAPSAASPALPVTGSTSADGTQNALGSIQTPISQPEAAATPTGPAAQMTLPQGMAEITQAAKSAAPAKKPATGHATFEAAAQPTPAGTQTTPQTPSAATPTQPPQSGAQGDTGQNAGTKDQGPQSPGVAQTQNSQAQPFDFKPDASAAALPPQPASPTVQNAPTPAPALVAQNAPMIVPPEALGVAIARKALEGVNKFELRLDPPELGRIDVTLEVDDTGATRAHIRAERPEALELLQREAKGMEQALRQAGLSLDQSSLSFSLNGREGREAQEHQHHGRRAKFNAVLPEDEIHAAAIRGNASPTNGVDLRV